MTWREWISSDYNIHNYVINPNGTIHYGGDSLLYYRDGLILVYENETITNGIKYESKSFAPI